MSAAYPTHGAGAGSTVNLGNGSPAGELGGAAGKYCGCPKKNYRSESAGKSTDTRVHKNPAVRKVFLDQLGAEPRAKLVEPLDYSEMVRAMAAAYLVITDSGGIQEEAPALGKPVLVLREKTERPEAVSAGTVKLVGTDTATIVATVNVLLNDQTEYLRMAKAVNPYGDGKAAPRILAGLRYCFGLVPSPPDNFVA